MIAGIVRATLVATLVVIGATAAAAEPPQAKRELPDIRTVPPDLATPAMTDGPPAPGRRVRQVLPEYQGTQVYHLLYLPTDWQPGRRYPLIVEYAGNGPYSNALGDLSTGRPEGSNLGYGISGGQGFVWVCMPYVDTVEKKNQIRWWGDLPATLDYCRKTIRQVCEQYGGDPAAVILTGFSRGALGCNYLGLHDDTMADIWLAFIPYSHYDGVRSWNYPEADRASALLRLNRLKGRAQFICQEGSVEETRAYLASTGVKAPFTFETGPFRNHNDGWVLRDVPARAKLRAWLADVLRSKPGTAAIRGRVVDGAQRPVAGVRVETGATHWTVSNADGRYELGGLVAGRRTVTAAKAGLLFAPRDVDLGDRDLDGIDFRAASP